MKLLICLTWMAMEQLKGGILSKTTSSSIFYSCKYHIPLCRILLNLSGIEDIDNIGLESSELMRKIDADGSGMIDRLEWREKWQSMQKHLGKYNEAERNNLTLLVFFFTANRVKGKNRQKIDI